MTSQKSHLKCFFHSKLGKKKKCVHHGISKSTILNMSTDLDSVDKDKGAQVKTIKGRADIKTQVGQMRKRAEGKTGLQNKTGCTRQDRSR